MFMAAGPGWQSVAAHCATEHSHVESSLKQTLERSPPPATCVSELCTGTSKLLESRPAALSKFLPSSHELGNTSSSEGEKDSPPPEWDAVPVHKPSSCKYGVRSHCVPWAAPAAGAACGMQVLFPEETVVGGPL